MLRLANGALEAGGSAMFLDKLFERLRFVAKPDNLVDLAFVDVVEAAGKLKRDALVAAGGDKLLHRH